MTESNSHALEHNYSKNTHNVSPMRYEEAVVLARIIYPFQILDNKYTQHEVFEKIAPHLRIQHFRSHAARVIWKKLHELYQARMPFCEAYFEQQHLIPLWMTSGVENISAHVKMIRGDYERSIRR